MREVSTKNKVMQFCYLPQVYIGPKLIFCCKNLAGQLKIMKTCIGIYPNTSQADEIWENLGYPKCDQEQCGFCECCCQHGVEMCVFNGDEDCGDEDEYQAGFKFPVVKFLNPGSSEKTCVDDDGKTRKVGIITS